MAFFDKLRVVLGVDDDEFGENDYLNDEPIQPTPQSSSYGLGDRSGYVNEPERQVWAPPINRKRPTSLYPDPPASQPRISQRATSAVDSSPGNTLRALTQRFKIVVVEPRVFEDSTKLVDNLKSRKPVIINLEKVEWDTARKIFDFLNGATYALSGNVQKIANNIFVFLPENVDVSTNPDHDANFGVTDGSPWNRS